MRSIELYQTANGRIPFNEWFLTLDEVAQQKIDAYIDRMARGGSQGNIKSVGKSVYELKIDYGPGIPGVFWRARSTDDSIASRRQ